MFLMVLRSTPEHLRRFSGGRGMGSHGRQLEGWVPGGHTIASYSQFRIITYSINKVPKNVTNQVLPEISDSGDAPETPEQHKTAEILQRPNPRGNIMISSVMIIIVISQLLVFPKWWNSVSRCHNSWNCVFPPFSRITFSVLENTDPPMAEIELVGVPKVVGWSKKISRKSSLGPFWMPWNF